MCVKRPCATAAECALTQKGGRGVPSGYSQNPQGPAKVRRAPWATKTGGGKQAGAQRMVAQRLLAVQRNDGNPTFKVRRWGTRKSEEAGRMPALRKMAARLQAQEAGGVGFEDAVAVGRRPIEFAGLC